MKYLILIAAIIVSTKIVPKEQSPVKYYSIQDKDKLVSDQKGYFWCWAASMEGIFRYFDENLSQEEIIKTHYNKKYITPNDYLSSNMALYPKDSHKYFKLIKKAKMVLPSNLELAILDGKPILALYKSHMSIITGYRIIDNKISFELMDPAYKKVNSRSPFRFVSREDLLYKYQNTNLGNRIPSQLIQIHQINRR
jgi:hypothetical protein